MDGFFPLPEGRIAYFLVLIGRFFRERAGFAVMKIITPALLMHLLLYININACAEAITSPPKPPLNNAKIEENAQEAKLHDSEEASLDAVLEFRGGRWRRFLIDVEKDEFVIDPVKKKEIEKVVINGKSREDALNALQGRGLEFILGGAEGSAKWCLDLTRKLLLPDGYPTSVTGDYLGHTLWRMGQGIASQINGVLTTQALLYAVGLGKGAIPTAAAVNWVLKDGIGYLSKILLSKYGRHFDVHPKGWRLLADLIENTSYGLELLTPAFPHLFVYLGAAAGAGRSAAGLIQGATRSCFYAGFAAQRNFAEVIAKGEAQGMVSKSLGIILGIAISGYVGSSGPLLVATFTALSVAHMLCNLRSYQVVHLRTLNPYRASLVFGEYTRRGVVPSIEEVNAEEPIFTEVSILKFRHKGLKNKSDMLSLQTKEDAAVLAKKLKVGVTFGNVVRTQQEADALFNIYHDEQYVLVERQSQYQVLLKMGATSHDLLRMMLQVCYLYQLHCGNSDLSDDGALKISYRYMADRFERVQHDLVSSGWVTSDGLVSRPLPYRLVESIPVNPVSS